MEILKKRTAKLTKKQEKIADYLKKVNLDVEELKIETIAKTAKVGYSTIYNFIQKLGYKTFKEFKKAAFLETTKVPVRDITNWDSLFEFYKDVINLSSKVINTVDVNNFANQILAAETIFIVGIGSSNLVAKELAWRLVSFGLSVVWSSESLGTERAQLFALNSKCLVVGVSISGYTGEIIHLFQIAKEKNINIALITSNKNSLAAKYSNNTIICANASPNLEYESLVSPIISALIVVDIISKYLITNNPQLMKHHENLRNIFHF